MSSGLIGIAWQHWWARGCRRVHSGSRSVTRVRVGVVELIGIREVSIGREWGSPGSFGFACVH